MALGFGEKKEEHDSVTPAQQARKKSQFGMPGYYDGFMPDQEKGGDGMRKMSRIDQPITTSIGGAVDGRRPSVDENGEGDLTIGKQMELEADNAIKYRTCSWQKV